MKKTFYSLFLLLTVVASCDKKDKKPELPDVPVETTMNRSIDFTVRGTEKDTAYTKADKINTGAVLHEETILGVKKNSFSLYFDAGPHVNNAAGDFIMFQMDKEHLLTGYKGTYSVGGQAAAPLRTIRYVFGKKDDNGGYHGVIIDNSMGSQLTGTLEITAYDAKRQTINGTYQVATQLTYDPTDRKVGYNPEDACNVLLTGTFANVKIIQN